MFAPSVDGLFLLLLKLWVIVKFVVFVKIMISYSEKYYGDVLLQKTYIADFFTGKQLPNRGECESYLLKDHHEAIIPREMHG